jgi:hypothetical protein
MAKVAAQRESLQMMYSNILDSLSAQGTVQPIIEAVLTAEQSEVGDGGQHLLACTSSSEV